MSTISPLGNVTNTCIPYGYHNGNYQVTQGLAMLNIELNSIMSQGYKLIETNNGVEDRNGFLSQYALNAGTTFLLAIP